MAKIGLSDGFSLIPEGTHVFKITGVSYKEAFGKLEVTMQTQSGAKHIERFSLLKADGSANEGALNAFSYFAKTALQDFGLSEIDHEDLVGHFMSATLSMMFSPTRTSRIRPSPSPVWPISGPLMAGMTRLPPHPPLPGKPLLRPPRRLLRPLSPRVT